MSLLLLKKTLPAGGGVFNPGTLTELKAWYKTPFGTHADGDSLLGWPDSSPAGNNITFSSGVPSDTKYRASIRNGRDVVNVTGNVRKGTTAAAIDLSAGGSIYFVGNPTFGTAGMLNNVSGHTAYRWGDSGGLDYFFDIGAADLIYSPVASADWHIHSVSFTTTTGRAAIDGVDAALYTSPTPPMPWGNEALEIPGSLTGATTIWWGDIGEVLICAPALNSTDHGKVITYLKANWAIT